MRLIFIGDIHLYDLNPPWSALWSKRALGQANLWMHRRHVFDPALLKPVLEHAMSLSPDWLLFSGDLTTTALDSEFQQAAKMLGLDQGDAGQGVLEPLLSQKRVLAVPGNHDRYTFSAARRRRLEVYMGDMLPSSWPCCLRLSPQWQLVALDSGCPRVFSSRGRVGRAQLDRLRQIVTQGDEGQGFIVLCHYPFDVPRDRHHRWTHRLEDREELAQTLGQATGPVVFVHGHIHRPWQWTPVSLGHPDFRVINAGSPCMTSSTFPAGQGFWELNLPDDNQPAATRLLRLRAHRPTFDAASRSIASSSGETISCHGLQWQTLEMAWSDSDTLGD